MYNINTIQFYFLWNLIFAYVIILYFINVSVTLKWCSKYILISEKDLIIRPKIQRVRFSPDRGGWSDKFNDSIRVWYYFRHFVFDPVLWNGPVITADPL